VTTPPRSPVLGAGSTSSPARARSRALEILLARGVPVVLVALTAGLSAFQLGRKSLWHDEAFTLAVARSDGGTFWRSLQGRESFAALYYSVIRLLPPLWADEASLRAPSVVFAVLTTLTCYLLARRLFGLRVAGLAALLLSVNVFFVHYAQEARSYALALWLTTLATWALVGAVRRPTWWRWLGYGAICAVAVYAHFFAALVLAGHLLSLLLHRSLVPWRKVAGAAGLAGMLVLPLAAVLLATNAGGRPLLPQSSVAALPRELAGIPATRVGIVEGLVFGLCGIAAGLAFLRQGRVDADPVLRWRYTLLACWLAVPVIAAALVSLFWPVFVTRYFVVCLPALVLLVAVGLAAARPAAQLAALLVVLLISAHGLHVYYLQTYKEGENWRGLVQHVADEARPGDSVVFLSRYGRRPFEYYLSRDAGLASALVPSYPSMPWGHYPPVVGEAQVGATGVQAKHLESAAPDRVWVVLLWGGFGTGDDDGAPFHRVLTQEYVETEHRFFGRYLKLALFERT
jgi:mannosyltransferase